VPVHIRGNGYLRDAIGIVVENPNEINYVTKSLYPTIAKNNGTTPSRVERAIRRAIEVATARGDIDYANDVFGHSMNPNKGKPTNSEFIAAIADKLRIK
jgi:two-component system response regulator (stage 0 sporulation protein A)